MNSRPISYRVTYNQKNITKDISEFLLSLTYKDAVQGESDEFEISLEDSQLLWQNEWYPTKGDKVTVEIIDGDLILPCGTFSIDEIDLKSDRSGDIFNMRGIAAAVTKQLRTKRSTAHESKTLAEIARTIASKNGLTVSGAIDNIRIERITQYQETDLRFLARLAGNFGYTFSVRDTNLVFTSVYDLEKKDHVLTLDKTDVISFAFNSKSDTAKKSNVKYHDPATNDLIEAAIESDDSVDGSALDELSADDLNIYAKAENKQQAEAIGKSKLHSKNSHEQTTSISCPGNILILSGSNIELTGFGRFTGKYHIIDTDHSVSKSGSYATSFTAKKVAAVAPSKAKSKTQKIIEPANTEDFTWFKPGGLIEGKIKV